MRELNLDPSTLLYRTMLGVGGIGSGAVFALNGEATLGREESRSGHFLERRDYCKLHIISHYVKILLGEEFHVMPIGKVGNDPVGARLLEEMIEAGLDLRHVRKVAGEQTLYSFCFLYPDGSGGNLTTDNSACDQVGAADIARAEPDFANYRSLGVALAAPEVPLRARQALLDMGTRYNFWRVAAFNSAEILPALDMGLLARVDLLALNQDEAGVLAGTRPSVLDGHPARVVESVIERLNRVNADLQVTITAGEAGSWTWDGRELHHIDAYPTEVVSTAGAGDAFLAGVIAGRASGLGLSAAQEFGMLVAAGAVASPHTIDPLLDAGSLAQRAAHSRLPLSDGVQHLLPEIKFTGPPDEELGNRGVN